MPYLAKKCIHPGDKAGNLWLSGNGVSCIAGGTFGRALFPGQRWDITQGQVLLSDRERGGVWLSFWGDGGVSYFKDGRVRASYTAADGLGKGPVADLQLDRDGALWAATQGGGLSRIKDGHIATSQPGMVCPCERFTGR